MRHLDALGAGPKRSLGQNFLVSETVIQKIISAADPEQFSQTIEIGPGLGALTDHLLEKTSSLKLIELDRAFAKYWKEDKGCEVHQVDALKAPWKGLLNQDTLLVSNLPYQISSRLLVDMSTINPAPKRLVFMFQKEVARRIQASSGQADYSLLSVVAQTFWSTRLLLEAGAVDFFPKPNVASRVVVFDRIQSFPQSEQERFLGFAKLCFEQKKKKMANRLFGTFGKEKVLSSLDELGKDSNVRVGQLTPKELLRLFRSLSGLFS